MITKTILITTFIAAINAIGWHNDVIQLTKDDFDDKIGQNEVALVEFYAPWCGHCKRLAPEYEQAAESLKKTDLPISLMKIDCTENTETCEKYDVRGYPTLKIFRKGKLSKDYNGPREADGIVHYMIKEAGPSSFFVEKMHDFEDYVNNVEHSIVGFFTDPESPTVKTYQSIADTLKENMRFGHTHSNEILDKFPNFKDKVVIHQPSRLRTKLLPDFHICENDKTLKDCIVRNYHGLVGHRTTKNAQDFVGSDLINVFGDFNYEKNPKGANYWRNRVIQAAKDTQDGVTKFAVSSWDDFKQELPEYGFEKEFTKEDLPVVVAKDSKGLKYRMAEAFSIAALKKFITDFRAGKLSPFMKSEEIPEDNSAGVKVLVAKNFDKIITDDKDALIEFYAPWCGHCKKLAPIYDELGEKLKDEPELVIAKMDATANDVPADYNVRGFPTIYFKKRGEEPVAYNGGREVKDFIKYLSAESTNQLRGYDRKGRKVKHPEL